jgi:hypothetical protein
MQAQAVSSLRVLDIIIGSPGMSVWVQEEQAWYVFGPSVMGRSPWYRLNLPETATFVGTNTTAVVNPDQVKQAGDQFRRAMISAGLVTIPQPSPPWYVRAAVWTITQAQRVVDRWHDEQQWKRGV